MTTLGLIGLGRMGGNMARRLARGGVKVVGFDADAATRTTLVAEGATADAANVAALVAALPAPRVVWTMLPSGKVSDETHDQLRTLLAAGDVVVDGANANYKQSQSQAKLYQAKGIEFVDVGVSGGVHGLANGYCLMAGGSDAAMARVKPILQALAPTPTSGWLHCGPVGSGHYVKMIHNGIEYGMMQAFAEGFALLKAKSEFDLPLADIGELWRHGSVVRSWLLDLTAEALQDPAKMQAIAPYVADSGEGRWTVDAAVELGIPAPVLSMALMMRFASQGKDDFGAKLLALMRQGFGGHATKSAQ